MPYENDLYVIYFQLRSLYLRCYHMLLDIFNLDRSQSGAKTAATRGERSSRRSCNSKHQQERQAKAIGIPSLDLSKHPGMLLSQRSDGAKSRGAGAPAHPCRAPVL